MGSSEVGPGATRSWTPSLESAWSWKPATALRICPQSQRRRGIPKQVRRRRTNCGGSRCRSSGREVGEPVLVEIRDGQILRILAGGTGPRHVEVAVTLAGQHEDALAAGNHEVEASVAIQIASLDRGGRASDDGVEAIEGEWLAASGGRAARARAAEARRAHAGEARAVFLITLQFYHDGPKP